MLSTVGRLAVATIKATAAALVDPDGHGVVCGRAAEREVDDARRGAALLDERGSASERGRLRSPHIWGDRLVLKPWATAHHGKIQGVNPCAVLLSPALF